MALEKQGPRHGKPMAIRYHSFHYLLLLHPGRPLSSTVQQSLYQPGSPLQATPPQQHPPRLFSSRFRPGPRAALLFQLTHTHTHSLSAPAGRVNTWPVTLFSQSRESAFAGCHVERSSSAWPRTEATSYTKGAFRANPAPQVPALIAHCRANSPPPSASFSLCSLQLFPRPPPKYLECPQVGHLTLLLD